MNILKGKHLNHDEVEKLEILSQQFFDLYISKNIEQVKQIEIAVKTSISILQKNNKESNIPQLDSSMTGEFYDHTFPLQGFLKKLSLDKKKRKKVLDLLQSRYAILSPEKKITELKEPVIKSKEELIAEIKESYEAALVVPDQLSSHINTIVSNLFIMFATKAHPEESAHHYILTHLIKSKQEIYEVDQDNKKRISEIKLQILLRLELEKMLANPYSTKLCEQEVVTLLRCIMIREDTDGLSNFVNIISDKYSNDLKSLVEEICDGIGSSVASNSVEDSENISSCVSPCSLASITTESLSRTSSSSFEMKNPPSSRPLVFAKNRQILVPGKVYDRTRINRPRTRTPKKERTEDVCRTPNSKKKPLKGLSTPKGKHILMNKRADSTPVGKQGSRNQWRKQRSQATIKNKLIFNTPYKNTSPVKSSCTTSVFRTPIKSAPRNKTPRKNPSLSLTPVKSKSPLKDSINTKSPFKKERSARSATDSPFKDCSGFRTPVKSVRNKTPTKDRLKGTPIKRQIFETTENPKKRRCLNGPTSTNNHPIFTSREFNEPF